MFIRTPYPQGLLPAFPVKQAASRHTNLCRFGSQIYCFIAVATNVPPVSCSAIKTVDPPFPMAKVKWPIDDVPQPFAWDAASIVTVAVAVPVPLVFTEYVPVRVAWQDIVPPMFRVSSPEVMFPFPSATATPFPACA